MTSNVVKDNNFETQARIQDEFEKFIQEIPWSIQYTVPGNIKNVLRQAFLYGVTLGINLVKETYSDEKE